MMISFLSKSSAALLLCAAFSIQAGHAQGVPAARQKISPPPNAELSYAIKAKQKGIPVEGDAIVRWQSGAGRFATSNEARAALIGKILDTRSEGGIDAFGLAPDAFTEKRLRREPTTTSFDRAGKTIRFSAADQAQPLKGGEQDRNSVIWQMISIARAAPGKFKPGASWNVSVAGQRDVDAWTFKVVKQEKISTPLGELNTVHLQRAPENDKDQRLDIWLAPSLEWYPARLRYSEDNGDYIEQTLQKVSRQ